MLWKIDYKDLLMADPEHEPSMSDKMVQSVYLLI